MDQSQRWRNFFSNVSHIIIKPTTNGETIKELAIAAKAVENRRYIPEVNDVSWQSHYTNL